MDSRQIHIAWFTLIFENPSGLRVTRLSTDSRRKPNTPEQLRLMSVALSPPRHRSSQAYRAVGWAGLLAGSLDITVAFVEAGLEGRSPVRLLQGIAGGLLGVSSFRGGLATAALGAFFHFLIATTAAAVFYLVSRKLKFLVEHPIPSGLLYGGAVYTFMRYFVLPISAYHTKIVLPPTAQLIRDVGVHMFMVGLPISMMVRKYSK